VPPTVAFDAVDYDNNSASHKNTTTIQNVVFYTNALTIESIMLHLQSIQTKSCFIRRISVASNAIQTIDIISFSIVIAFDAKFDV
jgi:hypothetical protein